MAVVETFESLDGCTVEILVDEDCDSPRLMENLGTFITWDRKYFSPDENKWADPFDWKDHIKELGEENIVFLPVYKYEHSGTIYSTTPFSCPWDSGQVGYIYATKEKVEEAFGVFSEDSKKKAVECLKAEVEVYSKWASGECFGYRKHKDGECIDSCYGFIGNDHKESGLFEAAGIRA